MSKKSRRLRHPKNHPVPLRALLVEEALSHARYQMLQGDFAGAIDTCQPLLQYLPKRAAQRVEVLTALGLAHGMLQHYLESYNAFSEALTIDPNNAELWYNHGLACRYLTRVGQSVRDFERAIALLGTDKGDLAQRFAEELAKSREHVQYAMKLQGVNFTLDQFIEQEEYFERGLTMMKANKWQEAEQAFRHVIEMGGQLPQHWNNLATCLAMQGRYDEAEAAWKHAITIDPEYVMARNNLALLPEIRREGGAEGNQIHYPFQGNNVRQSITFYKQNDEGSTSSFSKVEKVGNTIIKTATQLGKQPPRYRFFLNPYKHVRFTTCPQCGLKTRQRKLPLFIHIDPFHPVTLNKTCRYCLNCDLLIAHQDQIEEQLAAFFSTSDPEIVGNDYLIVGTVDQDEWKRGMQSPQPVQEMLEALHDFKEVVTFKRA